MSKQQAGLLGPVIVAMVGLLGCGAPRVATPEEFVRVYSRAWLQQDAGRVVAMESQDPRSIAAAAHDPNAPVPGGSVAENRRAAVEEDMKRRGFEFLAWSTTRFQSAREHGSHVHVTVTTGGATTEIILVREDGELRLADNPSSFD